MSWKRRKKVPVVCDLITKRFFLHQDLGPTIFSAFIFQKSTRNKKQNYGSPILCFESKNLNLALTSKGACYCHFFENKAKKNYILKLNFK